MLIKMTGPTGAVWMDIALLEYTHDLSCEESGAGAELHYRGVSGWVCFLQRNGEFVLINARHVAFCRAEGDGTQIETTRGTTFEVTGAPEWVSGLLNKAERHVREV